MRGGDKQLPAAATREILFHIARARRSLQMHREEAIFTENVPLLLRVGAAVETRRKTEMSAQGTGHARGRHGRALGRARDGARAGLARQHPNYVDWCEVPDATILVHIFHLSSPSKSVLIIQVGWAQCPSVLRKAGSIPVSSAKL